MLLRGFQRLARRTAISSKRFKHSLPPVALKDSASCWVAGIALFLTATSVATTPTTKLDAAQKDQEEEEEDNNDDDNATTMLLNWSGTHAVHVLNEHYLEPETIEELESMVRACHDKGQSVRPLGSALSPNGIGFQSKGVMSLANLDRVVEIDVEKQTVTVQAGARVSHLLEALRPYGLTLPNLASIAEQQMGGFVQVGAHGTGATVSPVDEYVTALDLDTPARGTLHLTPNHGNLFCMARVGMGCLGIVSQITMQCIPAHNLVEHTFVLTRQQAKDQLDQLLQQHKHMRYMWIPYTDAVVCVTNDPEGPDQPARNDTENNENPTQPLTDLLAELTKDYPEPYTTENMQGMGFGELRDALLAVDPLSVDHVKRCNEAEAEFWRRSEGYQTKPSDQLLQFDCGGQQWVFEVCFPTGTLEQNSGADMEYMEKLLRGIEEQGIAAPAPIEQRWSASSSSLMSPAHGPPGGLHSWIGIIMYLPLENEGQRRDITEAFTTQYSDLMRKIGSEHNYASHWAKLETPRSVWDLVDLQLHYAQRYPLELFHQLRDILDPKRILSTPLLDMALGKKR